MKSRTKTATTTASFVYDDIAFNKVLNSNPVGFLKGSAKSLGMVTAYGFAAFAWLQTTISIFSDDPEQRAEKRGYTLK